MEAAFAFVHIGSFSHCNAALLRALREEFPAHRVDVLDAGRLREFSLPRFSRLTWEVGRTYGMQALLSRDRFLRRRQRTSYYFDDLSRRIRERLAGRQYEFTIQTQALFDASQASTPHFLYTDHSHIENLRYPAFDQAELAHRSWIDAEARAYRNAWVNFTMSSNIARSLIRDYSIRPERTMVAGAGCNAAPEPNVSPDPVRFHRKRILFVGIDWERKGGPVLVEAFRRVRAVHPDAELVIVGCAPRLNVAGCTVVGRVPLADVPKFYRSSTLFCMPTRIEPFGLVYIEALAHGLPIVATRIGALPDFEDRGRCGRLVPPDDPLALAEALCLLLEKPALCEQMGREGMKLVQQRYSWKGTAARIANAIREATAGAMGQAA